MKAILFVVVLGALACSSVDGGPSTESSAFDLSSAASHQGASPGTRGRASAYEVKSASTLDPSTDPRSEVSDTGRNPKPDPNAVQVFASGPGDNEPGDDPEGPQSKKASATSE